uniref:Uncharacterized protein n=1 Tax=Opuntia streptacantha TaxID=393608 RepID=A0A7C8ZNF3_OPUST
MEYGSDVAGSNWIQQSKSANTSARHGRTALFTRLNSPFLGTLEHGFKMLHIHDKTSTLERFSELVKPRFCHNMNVISTLQISISRPKPQLRPKPYFKSLL